MMIIRLVEAPNKGYANFKDSVWITSLLSIYRVCYIKGTPNYKNTNIGVNKLSSEVVLGLFNAQHVEGKGSTWTGYLGPLGQLLFTTDRVVFKYSRDIKKGIVLMHKKEPIEKQTDDPIYLKSMASKRDQLKIAETINSETINLTLEETKKNFSIMNEEIVVVEPIARKTDGHQTISIYFSSDLNVPAHVFYFGLKNKYQEQFYDIILDIFPDKV